jgi:hypothetical protein
MMRKLALTLSHIVPNGCWPNIWKKCMAWWHKRPNLGGFQLLKDDFDIKTILKWTFTSWEKYNAQQQKEMDCDEPHLTLNEKT